MNDLLNSLFEAHEAGSCLMGGICFKDLISVLETYNEGRKKGWVTFWGFYSVAQWSTSI